MTPWLKFSIETAGTSIFILAGISWLWKNTSHKKTFDTVSKHLDSYLKRYPRRTGLASFLICLVIYELTLSYGGTFDEYSYAIAVRGPGFFYHPNHFVPHIFADLSYRIYHFFTHRLDSLLATKAINALFGALSVWLVYGITRRIIQSVSVALFTSLMFGTAFGTWKYATSGEVYTIMMTFLLLALFFYICLFQEDRINFSSLLFMALLMNLFVYSHNVSALAGLAFGIPLFIRNKKSFMYFIATGAIMFLILQTWGSVSHGIRSIQGWINHNFHYAVTGYVGDNALISLNLFKNLPLTLRDGTITIFAGIETSIERMGFFSRILTFLIYTVLWGGFFGTAIFIVRRYRLFINQLRTNGIYLSLSILLVVFGLFATIWTPGNDELLHWLIPFLLLVTVYSYHLAEIPPHRTALVLALFLPLVIISSLGTSSFSQSKLLSPRWLDYVIDRDTKQMTFHPGDVLIYRYDEAEIFANYYFSSSYRLYLENRAPFLSELRGTPQESLPLINAQNFVVKPYPFKLRRILTTTPMLKAYPELREQLALTRLNSSYWQIDKFPSSWPTDINLRVLFVKKEALRN
ncbi:MAG TPA: hypothetical protein PK876_08995 [Elusimicrobiota bacterium]|nr:hypothetical protein [Elusimicrobiota bacterium]